MNSIDANESLANQKYKRIPIDPSSNHAVNVFKFYDNGKTPNKISFAIGKSIRTDVMARDLKDQYDFELYTSGAKYMSSQYPEKFTYFAPLYLDAVVPEYFVIFRIPGASNYSAGEWRQKLIDPQFSQTQFANDVFQNAKIVKSFSLKEDSKIGKYIRAIRKDPMYSANPLYANFKPESYSLYRGISISSGTHVEVPERLDTVFQKSIGQLSLEKYVIGGFERNNIIHPKILNLEYLFSDETSEDYEINRYFGFYCNAIDLVKFKIDLEKMYQNDSDNITPLERIYTEFDKVTLKIQNPNGVVIRGLGVQDDISFLKDSLKNAESLIFPYIRSNEDSLHFIKSDNGTGESVAFSQNGTDIAFSIDDTKFDLGKMFGPNELFSQERASEIIQDTRSTVLLRVRQMPNHLDTIRVYHQNGQTFDPLDSNGKYDDLVFVKNYFSAGTDYSIDYLTGIPIDFSIPINPNLGSAEFIPNAPQIQNIQYVSIEDGSPWEWNGSSYVEGTVSSPIGEPVNFRMQGMTDPNNPDQVFSPNIETSSVTSIMMEKASLIFTVIDSGIFEVFDRVRISPGSTRYMLGQITAIDPALNQITVAVTEKKGGGTYSNWSIRKMKLGAQYRSTVNGSLWQTNGKDFSIGSVGTRIYINADGNDTSVLTERVQKAISNLEYSHITTSRFNNNLFIQATAFGDSYRSLAIRNKNASFAFLVNSSSSNELIKADGGSTNTQVLISSGNIQRLTPLLDELAVKTYQNWSRISRVSHSAVNVNNGFGPTSSKTVKDYLSNANIQITDSERIFVDYNKIEIRRLFRPSLGLLSLFEIKDIDFDTYSSAYSKIPEIDLYQYYFIPPDVNILDFQKYVYTLSGSGEIEINGQIFSSSEDAPVVWQDREGLSKYTVVSGDPVVKFSKLRPYRFSDLIFLDRGETLNNFRDNNLFGVDIARPNMQGKKSFFLRDDFAAALTGFLSVIPETDENNPTLTKLDLYDILGANSQKTITLPDFAQGFNFATGQEVKLTNTAVTDGGDLTPLIDYYLIAEVISYDPLTGVLSLNFTEKSENLSLPGSADTEFFQSYTVLRVDDESLFPVYRLAMQGFEISYVTARLENIIASATLSTFELRILSTNNEEVIGGPWNIYKVVQTESSLRSDIAILDADNNLQNFTGFFGLGADHSQPNKNSDSYEDRDKYLTNSLKTEYNVYLENFSKQFATENRITPYISKWGIIDSTDSRGNPYRLNSDICFGKDNFGPSHRETIPTAEKLTHEWFYIESKFNYALDPTLLRKNYYYFDTVFDVNQFINDPAYFEKYFTYVPSINGEEIDRAQFRYSKLLRNQFTSQYETVFNGAKFIFSELNSAGDILSLTNRFADYNFSILLKPVQEDLKNPQKPVSFRIIENKDAKSILILIEVALSGREKIGYELLFNSDELPGARLNQSTMFEKLYIKSESFIYPKIDVIYTCLDDDVGNAEFFVFRNTNSDIYTLSSPLSGTAISTETGLIIPNYTPQPGQTILVKKGDLSLNVVIAMPQSQIHELVEAGELSDFCLALDLSPSGPIDFSYTITNTKRLVIGNQFYSPILISKRLGQNILPFEIGPDNLLSIRLAPATWKSTFGDFRLSFNEGLSNLSYAFLYAAKDKKFNTVKSSFSTVKLAKGISLSPSQQIDQGSGARASVEEASDFSLVSKTLAGLPFSAFSLNSFINPISGTVSGTRQFGPIMMIDNTGQANIVINLSADLTNLNVSEKVKSLQNPRLADHALKTVSSTELIVSTTNAPKNLLQDIYTITQTPSGPIEVPINTLNTDYSGQTAYIRFSSLATLSLYAVADTVIIANGASFDVPNYLLAKITAVSFSGDPYAEIQVYYQNGLFASSRAAWRVTRPQGIKTLGLKIVPNNGVPELNIIELGFPVQSSSDENWTRFCQQFQLFGGKGYFTNLFENLSFANFIKLIDSPSEIVSWESYSNGQLLSSREFTIKVEDADRIQKKTVVRPIEQVVETGSRIQTGGYEQAELPSSEYEVFRYSGEYEVLFKPVAGFKYRTDLGQFNLDGANVKLNTNVSNFFVLPEFSYIKFSDRTILDLESANKFSANYPLIGESPIDYDKFNILSTSWDFNYHYKYSTKVDKTAIPGTNRIIEDYSFLSKLINLPLELTIEPAIFQPVTNREFEVDDVAFSATDNDIIYSVYPNEVRLKINFSRMLAKNILNKGLGVQFNNFFKNLDNTTIEEDSELIGNLNLTQYKIKYCELNLNKLFELSTFECFQRPDYSLAENSVSFSNVEYEELQNLGYSPINNVQINNPKSKVLTCAISKISSTGINIVPKLKIKYI